jgi:hypothetical protein
MPFSSPSSLIAAIPRAVAAIPRAVAAVPKLTKRRIAADLDAIVSVETIEQREGQACGSYVKS